MKYKNILIIIISIVSLFIFSFIILKNIEKKKQENNINVVSIEKEEKEEKNVKNDKVNSIQREPQKNTKLEETLSMYKQKTKKTTTTNFKSSIVQIKDKEAGTIGSGIIMDNYDGKIIIMTCKHVVNKEIEEKKSLANLVLFEEKKQSIETGDKVDLKVTFINGYQIDTTAIIYLPGYDMAILTIDYDIDDSIDINSINLSSTIYSFEDYDLFFYNAGQNIDFNGFETFRLTLDTVVLDIKNPFSQITLSKNYKLENVFGASGTGVFLNTGALVGMIYETNSMNVNYITLSRIMYSMKSFQEYTDAQ